ncbi:S8 family serine peptidase [Myroides sp. WP-1]|uniref:S8 family serine peptidase n=1 Tax=Myroides sp. WP-1 TaxID=2759944 RepID=UPI0015FA1F11|nr:S8 family serine peptidase [Myroides sp. WP-1]MBB1140792.1 S8 family serine peptidase [Myroides sp. WP-1]
MKKNTLLFILLALWGGTLAAQTPTYKKKVMVTYEQKKISELRRMVNQVTLARELALEKAKQMKKAIKAIDKKGNIYTLKGIDKKGDFVYYVSRNAGGRRLSGVTDIAPGGSLGLNLDGKGVVVGLWDSNVALDSHVEFQDEQRGSRVIRRDIVPALEEMSNEELKEYEIGVSHASHCAGTIGAKGVNPEAKGMAPAVTILSYNMENDFDEMLRAALEDVLLVSNHSYGPAAVDENDEAAVEEDFFGSYDEDSSLYDQIAHTFKYYQPVIAAGNDRESYDIINPSKMEADLLLGSAVAKNAIVVAAVDDNGPYSGPESITMSEYSNFGPTNDFRIKPDISAKGTAVFSANYVLPTPVTSSPKTGLYLTEDGTSMAAPAVTGIIALWQQWAMENREMPLKSATIRALMAHTASEAGAAPGPDHKFGWGLINAKAGVQVLLGNRDGEVLMEESELTQGASHEKTFVVPEGGGKFIATLTWTDPEGVFSDDNYDEDYAKENPSLVNDLDLRVYKSGETFYPWKLNKDFTNLIALKGDNDVDNVEKVEIELAEAGTYRIVVSHKGNLQDGKQEYSLLVSTGNFDTLSTEEFKIDESLFSIWPNPVVETLNITIPEEAELNGASIELFDLSGRRVHYITTINTNQVELDLKGLPSGVYIVKVKGNGFEKTERIVKK